MAKEFLLLNEFLGYQTLADKTKIDPRYLVEGSQNVLISNNGRKISTRNGYSLLGVANSARKPIEGSFDWKSSSGDEMDLRGYDDELEAYIGTINSIEFNAWERLLDSWSAVDFSFDTWWDTSEGIDLLLIVNGSDKIWEWSGGITTYSARTGNTLTKQGTNTWAQDRFLIAGTRKVRIKDDNGVWQEFTYTGGEATTTLTGVTPDPTTKSLTAGALAIQSVRENDNQPADGFNNDFIRVLNNQVYVGSLTESEVYISANDDFTDYTFSSPRIAGEGALLTLDSPAVGFAPRDQDMYIAAGKDDWYKTEFEEITVSTTLAETLQIKKLKTGANQAAKSHNLITNVGNNIAFISNEPALRIFGEVEELEGPQLRTLSNPIKPDFDAASFANGHIKFHKNRIYISDPANDRVYISEIEEDEEGGLRRFWQPPQVLPVRQFADIAGVLYGHSGRVPETYKLFDGLNDNGNSFEAKAILGYRSYGDRANLKNFDEWLTEGYISANTKLKLELRYDYQGYTQKLEALIRGDRDEILFQATEVGALGEIPLGEAPLGDNPEESSLFPKFKIINEFPRADFFEIQVKYSTDEKDFQWELLSMGGNVVISKVQPISIKV